MTNEVKNNYKLSITKQSIVYSFKLSVIKLFNTIILIYQQKSIYDLILVR